MPNERTISDSLDGDVDEFRCELLRWYDRDKRELPWRGIDDAYKTWVSEIMLQQTQVATVIDYYHRWMERFPNVESLARAEREEVMELWAGLGYYRRARFLHESAAMVVEEHGGNLPETFDGLKTLKGVGPYTAGAIASIAFERPVPVVDGNVERVLSRICTIEGDPKSTENQKRYWQLAEDLVDPERPGDFNQAMMELGATICTPSSPSCMLCPIRDWCRGFQSGQPESYPGRARRTRQKPVDVITIIIWRGGDGGREFLVFKRPTDGLLGGLWEFPTVDVGAAQDEQEPETPDALLAEMGIGSFLSTRELGEFVHHFSHIRMTITAKARRVSDEATVDGPGRPFRWVDDAALEKLPMSAAMRKVFALFEDD